MEAAATIPAESTVELAPPAGDLVETRSLATADTETVALIVVALFGQCVRVDGRMGLCATPRDVQHDVPFQTWLADMYNFGTALVTIADCKEAVVVVLAFETLNGSHHHWDGPYDAGDWLSVAVAGLFSQQKKRERHAAACRLSKGAIVAVAEY